MFLWLFRREKSDSNFKTPSSDEWPEFVVSLEKKNFDDFINKYPLCVVDVWAPWCSPCRVMGPRLRRLSKVYKGQVAFGKLNTQNHKDLAKKYHVMSIPYLVFFSFGKKVGELTGVRSVGYIKETIDDLLKRIGS